MDKHCDTCGLFIPKEIMCPKNRREMDAIGADGACGSATISFIYNGVIHIYGAEEACCGYHEPKCEEV